MCPSKYISGISWTFTSTTNIAVWTALIAVLSSSFPIPVSTCLLCFIAIPECTSVNLSRETTPPPHYNYLSKLIVTTDTPYMPSLGSP